MTTGLVIRLVTDGERWLGLHNCLDNFEILELEHILFGCNKEKTLSILHTERFMHRHVLLSWVFWGILI